MPNIFQKKSWGDVDWDIYLNNLDTLRKHKGLSKGQFNEFLGVWNAYRKRGLAKAGRETVLTVCQKLDVTEEWLGTEHGSDSNEVKQPQPPFDPHGGWKPRSIEEMTGVPKGLGLGKAVDLLATIYAAKDEMLIRAINANLEAFCSTVGEKERRVEREQELQQLEARVKELENIISKNGPVQVYSGPERRKGPERRICCDQCYPEENNKRNGTDRRTTQA
jgi:hypothetical protein